VLLKDRCYLERTRSELKEDMQDDEAASPMHDGVGGWGCIEKQKNIPRSGSNRRTRTEACRSIQGSAI